MIIEQFPSFRPRITRTNLILSHQHTHQENENEEEEEKKNFQDTFRLSMCAP